MAGRCAIGEAVSVGRFRTRSPCAAVANRLLLIFFLRYPGSVRSRQEIPHQSVRAFRALVRLGSIGFSTGPAAIGFLAGAGFFGTGGGKAPQIFVLPCVRAGAAGSPNRSQSTQGRPLEDLSTGRSVGGPGRSVAGPCPAGVAGRRDGPAAQWRISP